MKKFFTYIKENIEFLKGSTDNDPAGASSKKMTALGAAIVAASITATWAIWAYKNNDWTLLMMVLPAWLGLIYGALQINSSEKKSKVLNTETKEDKAP